MKLSRRDALLALAAAGCRPDWSNEGPAAPGFPCGVASGDVTSTAVVLWTVFDGDEAPLEVEWWPLEAPDQRRRAPATLAEDRTARVDVDDLTPGTHYGYRFHAGDLQSDLGQFRAAIATDVLTPLTFAAASCARQTTALTPLSAVAGQFSLDAFFCLGDAVYADGALTRADYAAKWRSGFIRQPNRLMRQATATIATWDDHETENDASEDKSDPVQLATARDAFLAWQPVRPEAPQRIWRRFQFGRTADVFVLDCRGERSAARKEYLSAAQLDWLEQGLASSQATFKLILNSVPITHYPGALFEAFSPDRWEGFPEQRRRILEFIDARPEGVLWLTGDFHMGAAGRVSLEGPGQRQLELSCGPAGASLPNPALSYPRGPQFDFATAFHSVTVLDLDPSTRSVRARFVSGDQGTLFDRTYAL